MDKLKFSRVWAMPNSKTFTIKPIKDIILRYCNGGGVVIDPFANEHSIKNYLTNCKYVCNDLDKSYDTDYHLEAQEFMKIFDDSSVDVVLYDPPYCYDGNTEVFTINGFKYISDVTKEDLIATMNTDSGLLEYHKPTDIIKSMYKGNMVKIDSQSINLLVTPNHKCWVKNRFYGKYHWVEAKDLYNTTSKVWFKKSCNYVGKDKKYFYLPPVKYITSNRFGYSGEESIKIDMQLWLKFLGLYLSEGCYRLRKRKYQTFYDIPSWMDDYYDSVNEFDNGNIIVKECSGWLYLEIYGLTEDEKEYLRKKGWSEHWFGS